MKFLVLWSLDQSLLSDAMVRAIARMPEYGRGLERDGKVLMRYHVVGAHGVGVARKVVDLRAQTTRRERVREFA